LGYARVSTGAQDLEAQRCELIQAGCERVHAEKISGAVTDRPELVTKPGLSPSMSGGYQIA
jgi:DNA invertase Pin-like site-specific DNA recombinase